MSLCIAWVRKTGQTEEVCVVSDSCVTGNQRFLAMPKLFPLKRGDCVIACAGDTTYSFPIVEHIVRLVEINKKLNDRALDLSDFIHTIVDMSNKVLHEETEKQSYLGGPNFSMIVAGYSWKLHKPILKEIKYCKKRHLMVTVTQKTIKKVPVAVIGDNVKNIRKDIYDYLERDGVSDSGFVDFQPLEVLLNYINDPDIREIGGYPQMCKVYPFLKVLPWGFVQKKDNEQIISYLGRPILHYETLTCPIYDIENKRVLYMKVNNNYFKLYHEEPPKLTVF